MSLDVMPWLRRSFSMPCPEPTSCSTSSGPSERSMTSRPRCEMFKRAPGIWPRSPFWSMAVIALTCPESAPNWLARALRSASAFPANQVSRSPRFGRVSRMTTRSPFSVRYPVLIHRFSWAGSTSDDGAGARLAAGAAMITKGNKAAAPACRTRERAARLWTPEPWWPNGGNGVASIMGTPAGKRESSTSPASRLARLPLLITIKNGHIGPTQPAGLVQNLCPGTFSTRRPCPGDGLDCR